MCFWSVTHAKKDHNISTSAAKRLPVLCNESSNLMCRNQHFQAQLVDSYLLFLLIFIETFIKKKLNQPFTLKKISLYCVFSIYVCVFSSILRNSASVCGTLKGLAAPMSQFVSPNMNPESEVVSLA